MPKLKATIEVQQNVHIIARERGKICARRDGHNIWLNLGREYLTQLMSYALMSPLTPVRDDRVRYMGLGIGGTRQLLASLANAAPLVTAYPGSNAQTDDDATVVDLERPVRVSGSSSAPPYNVSDVWLGQVQAPATYPTAGSVTYTRLFTQTEVSYNPFLVVPVCEVLLCTNAANPNVYNNTGLAYDTFESLPKTDAIELEVTWTIKF